MLSEGLIIKINSDTFTVLVKGSILDTKCRGKIRNDLKPLVGDHILVNTEDKVIEKILPRKNYLLRPNVANIDIALIVTSLVEPNLNLTLLDKLISIITIHHIEPVIILSKEDLVKSKDKDNYDEIFKYYKKIGYQVFSNKDVKKITKYLKGKIVTVCGQTGAGKSTLINKIKPELNLKTDAISKSLNRGKHTTRIVELFMLDDFYIVDTPGFSKINLDIYSKEEIKNSFKEFSLDCKYKDCLHLGEDGCEVSNMVLKGKIRKSRYDNYLLFLKESK